MKASLHSPLYLVGKKINHGDIKIIDSSLEIKIKLIYVRGTLQLMQPYTNQSRKSAERNFYIERNENIFYN
ncbi:hypothetical protein PUN28_013143 [Cardiocondyla obscurior]|uniref:Uncharacterized protein n=1 Tax=Cardiocondyla obscurior TaxID=286306 RepID=A0AAW2FC76_9HYME